MKKASKSQAKVKKVETLKEKIQRHLEDKDDVISEQDLKEVVVGVDAVDVTNPDEPSIQPEDLQSKNIVTPWDVLDNDK